MEKLVTRFWEFHSLFLIEDWLEKIYPVERWVRNL